MTVPDSGPSPSPSPSADDPDNTDDADDTIDRRIVRTELGIAGATLVTATLTTTAAPPTTGWWPVPLVALGWALLTAASDRSRLGCYLLYAGAVLAILGIVWTVVDDGSAGVIPIVLFGLGLGSAANRLVFGVLRPVPAVRRRRERSG